MACLTVLGIIGAAYLIPGAERFRLFDPKVAEATDPPAASDLASAPEGEVRLVEETKDRPELALGSSELVPQETPGLAPLPHAVREKAPPVPIIDPTSLDPFFKALVAVERKEDRAIARIVHYGDSLLAVDFVTGTLRRLLQGRFGDAGHGYMPIANPWPGYFHNDVYRRASSEWTVSRVVGPISPDGFYGLGGVSFRGLNRGAWARYGTTKEGDFGRAVSRFGVQYLEHPGGGIIEIAVDKEQIITIETAGETPSFRERIIEVPDGPHQFELRVAKGPVRAFGTWMERDTPGVVLDSIGLQGARLRFLDQSNDEHYADALRTRDPHLVVFEFGLNESTDGYAYPMERYRETSLVLMNKIRAALPNAACLVVAPNDVARKKGTHLESASIMPELVRAQREVAAEVGCAFFDTYQAMGGTGSMPNWVGRGLGQPDLIHPTTVGADVIGTWIFRALMDAYEPFRASHGGTSSHTADASAGASGAAGAASVPAGASAGASAGAPASPVISTPAASSSSH